MGSESINRISIDNSSIDNIVRIPIHIDENNVFDGSREILKVVRSSWTCNNIKFKLFTDGKTNILIGCYHIPDATASIDPFSSQHNSVDGKHEDLLLVRVYGNQTDLLIDRYDEQRNIQFLHKHGFAPHLHAIFKNGLVYDYVPGVTLSSNVHLLNEPRVWTLIARHMARMHQIKDTTGFFDGDCSKSMLWKYFQKFIDLIPKTFTNPEIHKRIKPQFLPIQRIQDEINELRQHLEALKSPIVFCHNDILLGNVIYTESRNQVTFIDYEYAFFNYQAFDIGDHFAEFAGMDNIDYSRYPSKEYQFNWLREYLEEYHSDRKITDADVHQLYVKVNKFALASHLFWAVWGLIQAEHSTIDYDFVDFAQIRYNEYLAKKDIFLSLQ